MRCADAARLSSRGIKRVVLLFLIVLLVSQACAMPFQFLSEKAPAGTPQSSAQPKNLPTTALTTTASPQIKFEQESLPLLAEAVPEPESSIGLNDSLVFYFTTPMDAESVQRGMEVTPPLAGTQEWLDDSTLRFKPAEPLPPATDISITFNPNVRSRQGKFLPEPVELHYRTTAALQVLDRIPAMDSDPVDPSAAILATFNYPVVALSGETSSLRPGFTLEPAATGHGEWINTSTYAFHPSPALRGGMKYAVRINPDLQAAPGGDWEFVTAVPRAAFSVPDGQYSTGLDVPLRITFNQPMDTVSVAENFAMNGPEGIVAGAIAWNDDQTEMTFLPASRLVREGDYQITLGGEAKSTGGTQVGKDLVSNFVTISQLAYLGISPDNGVGETLQVYENNYGLVTLRFNAPLDEKQDFTKLVTFTPSVAELSAFLNEDKTEISLSGIFQPGIFYILRLSGDIRDKWGDALGERIGLGLRTAPAKPTFSIPMLQAGSNILFLSTQDDALPAQATNLATLEITSGSLSLENFLRLAEDPRQDVGVERQRAWQQTLTLLPDVSTSVDIDLTGFGEKLAPGLYYYKIESPQLNAENSGSTAPFLVVSSDIQLTLKRGASTLFLWAYSLSKKQPVSGLDVRVFAHHNTALANGITGEDGSVMLQIPTTFDPYAPLYAVAGQPGEENFSLASTAWHQGVAGWDFGIPYSYEAQTTRAYIYTDRPVYRPGQTVYFRVVVRDREKSQYLLPRENEVVVQFTGPGAMAEAGFQTEQALTLSGFGTASGELVLPEDAQSGYYSLAVRGLPFQAIGFQVASYHKPEIDLQTAFAATEIVSGADIRASVTAAYYFGAPAGGVPVVWTLSAVPESLFLPDGFQAAPLDTSWLTPGMDMYNGGRVVRTGEGITGADGILEIQIAADVLREELRSGVRYRLQLEATLQDESGNPVSARGSMVLHPADYYIGLRAERYALRAGDMAGFDVRTVDSAAAPSGEHRLRAEFKKVIWLQSRQPDPVSGLPNYEPKYTLAGSTDFITDAAGQARVAFSPQEPGTYALEISGEGASSALMVWVGGEGTATWLELPNQRLKLTPEQAEYAAGQTARIFVPNPYNRETLALVTVERNEVMRWQVLTVRGAGESIEIGLETDDAPNVFVSVLLMGAQADGRADFRMGYLNLLVKPEEQLLRVDIAASPKSAEPGGEVEIAIRARDVGNQPAAAEFSLALVDKAALAIADPNAPGITAAFYGIQPLAVSTGLSLAAYSARIATILPGRGGGGEADASVDTRQEFADTAYWNGRVQTDADGRAVLRIPLPDNLTTWAVDARGITQTGQVGEAAAELVASKPLLIRPVTPRFLVAGDHVQLAALVHNNTHAVVTAQVRLDALGMVLDDTSQTTQTLQIEAGGRARVIWWATAQATDEVDLIFSVSAGDLQDVTRPVYGKLPVLRYEAAQVFATSGVLAEAGQRTEWISLPRTYTPSGGDLRVELSSSLAGGILAGLPGADVLLPDSPEMALSRLLPVLEAYRALQSLGADVSVLETQVQSIMMDSLRVLRETQRADGGWGWTKYDASSDARISAYILFGLARAREAGISAAADMENAARRFVSANTTAPQVGAPAGQLDRLVFQSFALQESGATVLPKDFVPFAMELSPWAKALLAVQLERASTGDADARSLELDLRESAVRSATGVHWDAGVQGKNNQASTLFTSAVVVYALARLDPADPLLVDAARYLVSNRRANGGWATGYETAWALLALTEALRGTGDLNASFNFSASLNGNLLAGSGENALSTVNAFAPLASLRRDGSNDLVITRGEGSGKLYYRAFLQVFRPAETAPAVAKGMTITRSYEPGTGGATLQEVKMGTPAPVLLVRLTLTLPQDASNVVVEDTIPAGTEILDLTLKTAQQTATEVLNIPGYDPANPFGEGWRWWLFQEPQISDRGIRWYAASLPAGVYQLTYRLVVNQPGEYRLIPARAYAYYFSEVQGSSAGGILTIQP